MYSVMSRYCKYYKPDCYTVVLDHEEDRVLDQDAARTPGAGPDPRSVKLYLAVFMMSGQLVYAHCS